MHGSGLIRNILAGVAPLIAAAERERIANLAEAGDVTVYVDDDGSGIAVGVPFAEVIRRSTP
jgi:hypothetical protein